MIVSIIAAVAQNGAIGRENRLPWHIPEDFAWFREKTRGRPVIMGRKTYESIGRLLPGRRCLILSTREGYTVPGAEVLASLGDALLSCAARGDEEAFVIGGESLFREALPVAGRLYLTVIHRDFEGDAFFPEIPGGEFRTVFEERHGTDDSDARIVGRSHGGETSGNGAPALSYTFRILERVSPSPRA